MATRDLVPRNDGEGEVGTAEKRWLGGHFKTVYTNSVYINGTGAAEKIYPEWYGAEGDGTTDDSLAVAAAVAALAAGGTLEFMPTKTYCFANVHITKSINIDIGGAILKALTYTGAVSKKMFYSETADAVGSIEIRNGKFNGSGTTRGVGITQQESLIDIVGAGTVKINNIEVYNHAAGVAAIPDLLNDQTQAAIRIKNASRVIIDKIIMHDNWNEQTWICSDSATSRVSITNSQWYNGQVNPANTPINILNVASALVEGNTIIESNGSAMNVVTANAIIRGNYIDDVDASNAIDLAESMFYANDSIIENNIIKNAAGAGVMIMGSRIKIINNTISGCLDGVQVTVALSAGSIAGTYGAWTATTYTDIEDITISGNTITDCNYTGSMNGTAIFLRHTDAGNVIKGVKISGNYISQPGANASKVLYRGILLYQVEYVDILDNYIYDWDLFAIYSAVGPVSYLTAKGNHISSRGFSDQSHIYFDNGNTLQHVYEGNYFEEVPTYARYNIYFTGTTLDSVRIVNNEGLKLYNVTAANLYYRKDNYPNVTTTPATGTYNIYDIVRKTPATGSVEGYVMLDRNGTLGTLNSGNTTGSITTGTNSLVVNSATGLTAGCWIVVTGAGALGVNLNTMVTKVAGTTITLWDNASTTVVDAAITYLAPTVETMEVTNASKPAFSASGTSQDNLAIDSDVTVLFGTEVYDQTANFASNTFTAPVTGKYLLSAFIDLRNLDSAASWYKLTISTTNRDYPILYDPAKFSADIAYWPLELTVLADMDVNDTASVIIRQSGGTQQADINLARFFGALIC